MQDRTGTVESTRRATPGGLSPEDLALTIARQTNRRLELDRIAALKADSPGLTDAEAYRRLFESAIGPRFEGTIYRDAVGTWEVLEVLFGDAARMRLPNTSWVLVERSIFDHKDRRVHRFGWTQKHTVLMQPAEFDVTAHAAEAASALAARGLAGMAVQA
ncbi:hypothetical protein [Streptomyces sp. AC1-42T]|uniref:hypothetical protein n=1 Tax=Streptomyces sp. AC1-42T TaxID=2218665 RepID=UPI000DAC52E4|nr:hypothetical protein [Streptomyces sp. AC1-42T]PZT71549.1 hypothetical protein DNK55_33110 [Streptomyces sp. AC1-42T]